MILSFAQYEREVIGERIRHKIAATKAKGMYTGGMAVLGYNVDPEVKRPGNELQPHRAIAGTALAMADRAYSIEQFFTPDDGSLVSGRTF